METEIRIRKAAAADAEKLVELMKEVEDSGFMLFEPGERKTVPEQFKKRIEGLDGHSAIFLAEENGVLQGYLFAIGDALLRKRYSAYVAIGIREGQRGKGIGTKLFRALEQWAREKELRRIELTVLEHNAAGLALYQKMGFEIEGIKKDSLYINGEYVNEYYMAKIMS
ncbi:GNAT family N-acetyltransferase [Planococcus chinensis]|uniref:GNAT family N-acetyltransferase n=1 Tax=Planococcus chinensis TaxID=272917 RepID=UPI001CC6E224|nr:GNAT family N-acetyltransferase [Planococcus chinensis]